MKEVMQRDIHLFAWCILWYITSYRIETWCSTGHL